MQYLFLFLFELIVLFFLSRALTKQISLHFYRITRKKNFTVYLLAFLFFPGTLIHELAHFFMAIVLFVKVGDINFFPTLVGNTIKMGSVQIAKCDPFRRFLIGVAPLLAGMAIVLSSLFYFQQINFNFYLKVAFVGYILFQVSNSMFSSRKDMEGAIELLIALAIIVIILSILGIRVPLQTLLTINRIAIIKIFDMLLIIPIALDLSIIGLLRMLQLNH